MARVPRQGAVAWIRPMASGQTSFACPFPIIFPNELVDVIDAINNVIYLICAAAGGPGTSTSCMIHKYSQFP